MGACSCYGTAAEGRVHRQFFLCVDSVAVVLWPQPLDASLFYSHPDRGSSTPPNTSNPETVKHPSYTIPA